MSYNCEISFKEISGEDVYDFLLKFKQEAIAHISEIAERNAWYSPLFRKYSSNNDSTITHELRDETIDWAKLSVFRYRYFYNKKLQLLGMYGVDDSMQSLFDCTVYFQNSTNQDYSFDEWNGVKYFVEVANKWKQTSDEEVKAWHTAEYNEPWDQEDRSYTCDLDYYRRSAAYREIWQNFEQTLYDDDSVVYLSLFGFYDFKHMSKFYECIRKSFEN